MRFRRAALWGASAMLLLPAAAGAQRRTSPTNTDTNARIYSVRGNVRSHINEAGVEMIRVELRKFTGEVVTTTFTRTNGEFEFPGVSNGNYLLVVDETGYESVRENVEIMNSSRIGIVLYLKKATGAQDVEGGNSVSARELQLARKVRDIYRKGLDTLHEKKDFSAAAPLFRRVISEAPDFYEAHFYLGISLMELSQMEAAEVALRRSIELGGKTYQEPYFALASLLSNLNKFAEAEAIARVGVEGNPARWQGHYELARALMGLNRVDEAEKSANDCRALRADYAPTYLVLANVHIRRKQYPSLLQDLNDFLRLEPSGPMSEQARKMRDQVQQALQQAAAKPQQP